MKKLDTGHHDRRLAKRLEDPEFKAAYEREKAELEKPDAEPEPWENAALDVPMTLSDIEAVRIAFGRGDMKIPENLEAAMVRAHTSLSFLRTLCSGGYRAG